MRTAIAKRKKEVQKKRQSIRRKELALDAERRALRGGSQREQRHQACMRLTRVAPPGRVVEADDDADEASDMVIA